MLLMKIPLVSNIVAPQYNTFSSLPISTNFHANKMTNLLIADFATIDQSRINFILSRYPRLRDIYNMTNTIVPTIQILNLIATANNCTLVSRMHFVGTSEESQFPMVFPSLRYWGVAKASLLQMHQNYQMKNFIRGNKNEGLTLVPINSAVYNFAYCSAVGYIKDENFFKAVLLNTAEYQVWLCLLMVWAGVSLLMAAGSHNKRSSEKKDSAIFFLLTFSVLVSGGPSGSSTIFKRSLLFTQWTVFCLLFANFYSSSLTSVVISPTPEQRMTKIVHLVENNFSLISPTTYRFSTIDKTRFFQTYNLTRRTSQNKEKGDPENANELLRRLLVSIRDIPTMPEFFQLLATGDNLASLSDWNTAFYMARNAEEYLELSPKPACPLRQRRCTVGKEPVFPVNLFFGFTPPGSSKLGNIFRNFIEFGICGRWVKESVGIITSRRVQDRQRMLRGDDKIRNLPMPLKLKGKLTSIFIFSWYSQIACFGVFGLEVSEMWLRHYGRKY